MLLCSVNKVAFIIPFIRHAMLIANQAKIIWLINWG